MKSLYNVLTILRSACVHFTVITLVAQATIFLFLDPATDGLLPKIIFGIFGFALMFSIANFVYFKTNGSTLLRYFIHLILTIGSAIVLFMIPNKQNGPAALFVGVCLTVVHMLVFLIINVKSMGKEKKEYKPVYDKLKKD